MKRRVDGSGFKMYKGSDGTLTTRDAFMRIIAKKRAATVARDSRVGGRAAYEKMYKRSVLPRSMNKKFGKMGGR